MKRRILSILISFCMVMTLLPTAIFATESIVGSSGSNPCTNAEDFSVALNSYTSGSASASDNKVTLSGDITTTSTIYISATDLFLDLNGHSITYTGGYNSAFKTLSNSNITIKDSGSNGKIQSTYPSNSTMVFYNEGTININGGTITSLAYRTIFNTSNINISGGIVESKTTKADSSVIYNNSGNITITGGTLKASTDNVFGIWVNNNYYSAEFNISGGTVSSTNYPAICINGRANLQISGGTITSSNSDSDITTNTYPGTIHITGEYINSDNVNISENANVTNTDSSQYAVFFKKGITYAGLSDRYTNTSTGNVGKVFPSESTPVITVQPTSSTQYTINDTPTPLSIEATNATSYQWYKNQNNSITGATLITGETNSTYTPPTDTIGATYYFCVASGTSDITYSNFAMVNVVGASATITFNSGDGTGSMDSITTTIGASYKLPSCTFTAPDYYHFKSWEVNGEEKSANTYITIDADTEITALWAIDVYTISFRYNGGSGNMSDKYTYANQEYTFPDCQFTAPDGKVFKCWKIDNDETEYNPGDKTTLSSNIIVRAQWKYSPYTISFNKNGGNGNMSDIQVEPNSDYTLPDCTFTSPSYKQFKCWSIDGNEKAIGDIITISANTTITAVWEDIPVIYYTISFDSNGGTGNMNSVQKEEDYNYSLPDCFFTAPEGKEFKCWSIDGTEKEPHTQIKVTSDITVTAVWADINTTITITTDSSSFIDGKIGVTYSFFYITIDSTVDCTYTISSGSLPDGISLSDNGLISGTPTTAGTYTFTITATDVLNRTTSKQFTITVKKSGWTFESSTGTLTYNSDYDGTSITCDSIEEFTHDFSFSEVKIIDAKNAQNVTSIENNAFYSNDSCFTTIILPDNITIIDNGAFYVCNYLSDISIPDKVTSIGEYAFSECLNLQSITIPDKVTHIGDSCFSDAITLTSITFKGKTVPSIGTDCFEHTNLKKVYIPVGADKQSFADALGVSKNIIAYNSNENTSIESIDEVIYKISCANEGETVTITANNNVIIDDSILEQLKQSKAILEIKNTWYSWYIDGRTVGTPIDVNLTISQNMSSQTGDVIGFSIAFNGQFPFEAKLKIGVLNSVSDGTVLYLYKIVNGQRILQSSSVVTNGTITFERNSASDYIISRDYINSQAYDPLIPFYIGYVPEETEDIAAGEGTVSEMDLV